MPERTRKPRKGQAPAETPTPAAELVPWLTSAWERLHQARLAGRLGHALLLVGPAGVGKRWLAHLLARALLCQQPTADGNACGTCGSCRLSLAGTHPDLTRVGPDPESKSGEIGVGQIRDFVEHAGMTTALAPARVVIVDPGDRLNASAANALLKTLEEPPAPSVTLLIAEQPGRLPATIRSRCQEIQLPLPDREQGRAWLAARSQSPGDVDARLVLARGAPLRALLDVDEAALARYQAQRDGLLALAAGERDPVREADAWNLSGPSLSLAWLCAWLCDLARLAAAGADAPVDDPASRARFGPLAERLDPVALHRLIRRCLDGRSLLETTVNPLLLLESVLIEWCRLTRVPAGRGVRP